MNESYRDSHKAKGADYDALFEEGRHTSMLWRMEQSILDRIIEEFFPAGAGNYLDFACGTGRVLAHVSRLSRSATGLDVSKSMLDVAQRSSPNAELICGDITREDVLSGRRFDLITAFRFFPNAEDELRQTAIDEIVNRLRPGGLFIFNNHINAGSLAIRLARLLGRKPVDPATRIMSREEVMALIGGAGLSVVREYPMGSLPLSDRHIAHPIMLFESAERLLSRIPATRFIAQNIVYACQKRPG